MTSIPTKLMTWAPGPAELVAHDGVLERLMPGRVLGGRAPGGASCGVLEVDEVLELLVDECGGLGLELARDAALLAKLLVLVQGKSLVSTLCRSCRCQCPGVVGGSRSAWALLDDRPARLFESFVPAAAVSAAELVTGFVHVLDGVEALLAVRTPRCCAGDALGELEGGVEELVSGRSAHRRSGRARGGTGSAVRYMSAPPAVNERERCFARPSPEPDLGVRSGALGADNEVADDEGTPVRAHGVTAGSPDRAVVDGLRLRAQLIRPAEFSGVIVRTRRGRWAEKCCPRERMTTDPDRTRPCAEQLRISAYMAG